MPLIDQHIHGCWLTGEPAAISRTRSMKITPNLADFDSGLDSQLGFAVRSTALPSLDCLGTLTRRLSVGSPQSIPVKLNWLADLQAARGRRLAQWRPESARRVGVASVAGAANCRAATLTVVRLEQVARQARAVSGDYASAFNGYCAGAQPQR